MPNSSPFPNEHRPRRALGQNFLVDRSIRERIVEAVAVDDAATVLEIGPGRGALTEGLAERARHLILVELDPVLAGAHRERWAGHPGIDVIEGDILDRPVGELVGDPASLVVVGNIPYNITTPILFHLLRRPRPREIVLMVQSEVADRLLANPGTGAYGALTVGVRSLARVERLFGVPAGAFRPRPRVDSAVARITPIRPEPLSPDEEDVLRRLTRALFQWRRKQLGRTLRDHPDLGVLPERAEEALAGIGHLPRARPEELTPEEFQALAIRLFVRDGETDGG